MDTAITPASPDYVKNVIAGYSRLDGPAADFEIGRITLRKHQVDGADRVCKALLKFRGAMLCDEVGLGKTFTAAAVMRQYESTAVVAPAALIPMWEASLRRARLHSTLVSLEKFSRGQVRSTSANLVVVDEAHHFRNPSAQRFRNLATFIGRSHVLLLTATPVHNSARDIKSLLSLFMGSRANGLSDAEFVECVIRRGKSGSEGFPERLYAPPAIVPQRDGIRRAILDLPPPVPPVDGESAATLVRFTMLRQWTSSDASLRAGLDGRLAKARAIISALKSGRYPTRRELEAWLTDSADIQLGFPELLASAGGDAALLSAIEKHEKAIADLRCLLISDPFADLWRVEYLRSLRLRHTNRKIIAFTQFASTARYLFASMRNDSAVAMITSQRCEIASGAVAREFIIDRFAPRANEADTPPAREEITLLIATDLCSEGLNLQDASVVVHMDSPWTAARVEQRIGRIARPGGANRRVFIHSLVMPDVEGDLLRLADRLRFKSRIAAEIVGGELHSDEQTLSAPEARELIDQLLREWISEVPDLDGANCVAAQVAAQRECFIALATNGPDQLLICGSPEEISDDPKMILQCLRAFLPQQLPFERGVAEQMAKKIRDWLDQRRLEEKLGARNCRHFTRARLAGTIESIASTAPVHQRAASSLLADKARQVLALEYNLDGERALDELNQTRDGSKDWLGRVVDVGQRAGNKKAGTESSGFTLCALLIGRRT
jgi:superfamily II DNA or RNA helicase